MRIMPLKNLQFGINELPGDDPLLINFQDFVQPEKRWPVGDDLLDFVAGQSHGRRMWSPEEVGSADRREQAVIRKPAGMFTRSRRSLR